ncbi:MAG TPA: RNA polymerase sigma factor SigF, partial [Rugosimonospora sp.]|nr:RNA polymerase sigma factor SigF [Rugosimonospora sp.]
MKSSVSSTVDDGAVALLRRLASLPVSDASRVGVREAAIEAWLPLARHLAQRFHGRGEPVDDLVQ